MGESVNLSELEKRLQALAVPAWRRMVPLLLIALSLIESALALLQYPGLFRGFASSGRPETGDVLGLVLAHGLLLGPALYLRRDAEVHGAFHHVGGAQTVEAHEPGDGQAGRTIAGRLASIDGRISNTPFLPITAIVFVLGAAALLLQPTTIRTAPFIAAAWTAAALMLGYAAALALAARRSLLDLAGAGIALLLELFLLAATANPPTPGLSFQLLQIAMIGAGLSVLLYILFDDPTAGYVMRLTSVDGVLKPYHWAPRSQDQGKAYLSFGGSVPILAFSTGLDKNIFQQVETSDVNLRIPLHDRHLWIWNVAALAELVPDTVEVSGGQEFATAAMEISTTLGVAAVDPHLRLEQRLLDAAAHNLFSPKLGQKIRTSLNATFADKAAELVRTLERIRRDLGAAPTEIRESTRRNAPLPFDPDDEDPGFAAYRAVLLPLEEAADDYETRALAFEEKCRDLEREADEALAGLKMVTSSETAEISARWRDQLAAKLGDRSISGAQLTLEEGRRVLEMLGFEATISSVVEGERMKALRAAFGDARRTVEERYRRLKDKVEAEKSKLLDFLREKDLAIEKGVASDPIIALQVWKERARQPRLKQAGSSTVEEAAPGRIEGPERPKQPRER